MQWWWVTKKNVFFLLTSSQSKKDGGGRSEFQQVYFSCNNCTDCHRTVFCRCVFSPLDPFSWRVLHHFFHRFWKTLRLISAWGGSLDAAAFLCCSLPISSVSSFVHAFCAMSCDSVWVMWPINAKKVCFHCSFANCAVSELPSLASKCLWRQTHVSRFHQVYFRNFKLAWF